MIRHAPVAVTGLAAASALGETVAEHVAAIGRRESGLRPLREFPDAKLPFPDLLGGWIPNRQWMAGRRHGAASNAAVRAAKIAVAEAGWDSGALRSAWLFVGSSRGNVGELLGQWTGRRPMAKFAASNSMHGEIAAAVTVELGMRGPSQVLSNGCASGLDAIGLAWLAVSAGLAPRALAVGVDLPLCPKLLAGFASTGLLSRDNVNDPYSPHTTGFFPGEAVAAMTLEPSGVSGIAAPRVLSYSANSDAHDSVGLPEDGAPLRSLLEEALAKHKVVAVCPHATGTEAHRVSEGAALTSALGKRPVSLHLLKPFTGHSLGASGAIEAVILAAFLREGLLPNNLTGLRPVAQDGGDSTSSRSIPSGRVVLKIASGMGGHNALIAMTAGDQCRASKARQIAMLHFARANLI